MLDKEEYAGVILDLRSYPCGVPGSAWGSGPLSKFVLSISRLLKGGQVTEAECREFG